MTPIERQILINQATILSCLSHTEVTNGLLSSIENRLDETRFILTPKKETESACDMSNLDKMDAKEDAFGGKTE